MINGNMFRDAVIAASESLNANRQRVDELNVFPVPDGDTGTNMSMTLGNAVRSLKLMNDATIGDVSKETASCLLRGARGNSGVILSLLFRGISKGLKGLDVADSVSIAEALTKGVESAYKAVMKPTEGTILTVSRIAAERATAKAQECEDPVAVFEEACIGAHEALEQTPEILPVLKKAGVVDSGGAGLCVIYDAMLASFKGEIIETVVPEQEETTVENTRFVYKTEIEIKVEEENENILKYRAFIESAGEEASYTEENNTIKVSIRIDNPSKLLEESLKYGELKSFNVSNIKDQLTSSEKIQSDNEYTSVEPEKKYGFVAVAAGEGIVSLFKDLGADNVVEGGQTMNPSTDDILKAIELTPAEVVFVLPNNKNIIMAAEQAIRFASRKVFVLPTKSIPMGISAMLAFDEDEGEEKNLTEMRMAADNVGSGSITYAIRDSEYEGQNIKAGELMAISNGKLTFTDTDLTRTVFHLIKTLLKKETSSITLMYGKDVSEEQAEGIRAFLEEKYKEIEITMISGGQPVYYFIISVE